MEVLIARSLLIESLYTLNNLLVESIDKEAAGYKEFHSRRLVEIAGYIIISHIMLRQAAECEAEYLNPAKIFLKYAAKKITEAASYINASEASDVELFA